MNAWNVAQIPKINVNAQQANRHRWGSPLRTFVTNIALSVAACAGAFALIWLMVLMGIQGSAALFVQSIIKIWKRE